MNWLTQKLTGQEPSEVINSPSEGKEVDQSTASTEAPDTMTPKPALYESSKGLDSEHNLIAASGDTDYATGKEPSYDDMSEASGIVSQSDYSTTTDGDEESEASSRKERRSRRRRSYSRKKNRRSRSRDSRSRSVSVERSRREEVEAESTADEATDIEEEEVDEKVLEETAEEESPRRASTASVFKETEGQVPSPPIDKPSDQPYIKLLNFNTLHRTEQDRCPHYTQELEKIVTNWTACKTTLQRLLDEVKHANHLFHVSDVSFHQYSHVMYTIHKDIFLDDHGKRVLSSARQQLLLKQRGVGSVDGGRDEASTVLSGDGYLDPLYNSFSVLTDTMMKTVLERESEQGKQAASIEFQEFCEELISQAEAMRALGDSVVQELEGSEMDIQNSFQVLQQLAAKIKTSKSSSVLDEDIKLSKPDKNFPKEMGYGGVNANVGDWWLWETLYRAAVKHQQISWEGNEERMKGLEESLKYFQDKHQKKLEKAVLAVMPEQREMFLVGAKAFETALKKTDAFSGELEGKARLDHESIANEFEQGVQKRSERLMQKKTHHKSAILNRSRSKYSSAIQQAEALGASSSDTASAKPLPAFNSPVLSKLVLQTKVLERWDKAGWLTTIAVFTVDRFLHLFDCSDLDTKTLPQTAFASMFPTTASTRTNVHFQGGGRKKANRATEHKIPNPSLTFNLVTCTLKTYGYARRSFEIKQIADPTSKSRDLPHTTLRFKDNPEAAEWYALLQDLPDYNQGHVSGHEEVQQGYEEELNEVEAAKEHALYDDLEAEEPNKDEDGSEGNDDGYDLQDVSDSQPEEAGNDEEAGNGGDDFEDAFEDASEYLPDGEVGRRAENGENAIQVETVEGDDDDDSFHST